jgi:hypothetical protein
MGGRRQDRVGQRQVSHRDDDLALGPPALDVGHGVLRRLEGKDPVDDRSDCAGVNEGAIARSCSPLAFMKRNEYRTWRRRGRSLVRPLSSTVARRTTGFASISLAKPGSGVSWRVLSPAVL